MSTLTIVIICTLIYLLSIYFSWLHTKKAHSTGGIWSSINPEPSDIATMFIPIMNTITAIYAWTCLYPIKKDNTSVNKFFKIK